MFHYQHHLMICAITNCRSITTSFLLLKKQQGTEVHFHIATAHTTMVSCHISAKDPDPLNLNLIQARVQEIIFKNMDFGTTKTLWPDQLPMWLTTYTNIFDASTIIDQLLMIFSSVK